MNREQVFASPYAAAADRVTAFLRAVYGWMSVGLAITAVTAWLVAATRRSSPRSRRNRPLFWGLMIAQLGIVFGFQPGFSVSRLRRRPCCSSSIPRSPA